MILKKNRIGVLEKLRTNRNSKSRRTNHLLDFSDSRNPFSNFARMDVRQKPGRKSAQKRQPNKCSQTDVRKLTFDK